MVSLGSDPNILTFDTLSIANNNKTLCYRGFYLVNGFYNVELGVE
jgi:hypothetical protein